MSVIEREINKYRADVKKQKKIKKSFEEIGAKDRLINKRVYIAKLRVLSELYTLIREKYMKGKWRVIKQKSSFSGCFIKKNSIDEELVELMQVINNIQKQNDFSFRIKREHEKHNIDNIGNDYYVRVDSDGTMSINNIYDYDDIVYLQKFGIEFGIGVLTQLVLRYKQGIEKVQHEIDVWTLKKVEKL
jgi:hypothetical protein